MSGVVRRGLFAGVLVALVAAGLPVQTAAAAVGVSSFNPNVGGLVSIAFDPESDNLFIYPAHAAEILEFTTSGSQVGSGIPTPRASNDVDLDFALEPLTVAGVSVPTNTLLAADGETSPVNLYALDKDDGSIASTQTMPGTTSVGGAQHPARDSFMQVSYGEHTIHEFDPADGELIGSIPVAPEGSPPFSMYFGDIDVDLDTGNIVVVSSNQNVIRAVSPTGEWLGDVDVYDENDQSDPSNVFGMSGVAIDDDTNTVYVTGTGGQVWILTGLLESFSTSSEPAENPCETDPDAICGDEGDNDIQGTEEDDTIYAGEGNDTIDGGGGNDVIVGGAGNDTLTGGGADDQLVGGEGDDVLVGDDVTGYPKIQGRRMFGPFLQEDPPPPGNDTLDGGAGNDFVDGSLGNDTVKGGAGVDTVVGGAGKDNVTGQAGGDDLAGSGGPDVLNGGGGTDDMNGGPGKDTCVLDTRKEQSRTPSCERKKLNFKRN
ncbi:MAG TPA: hypothetical protein VNP73_08350 [Actinomycetota bacterium]|nr:hypothetical protein [Actinomycetota bacterium]